MYDALHLADDLAAPALGRHDRGQDLEDHRLVLGGDVAVALADELKNCGLRLVSGGTETHLVLVDVRGLIENGRMAEDVLHSVNIVTNKNMIPFDPLPANLASGIRIGSPALTSRGFNEADMRETAQLLARALKHANDPAVLADVKAAVIAKAEQYPMFADKWISK